MRSLGLPLLLPGKHFSLHNFPLCLRMSDPKQALITYSLNDLRCCFTSNQIAVRPLTFSISRSLSKLLMMYPPILKRPTQFRFCKASRWRLTVRSLMSRSAAAKRIVSGQILICPLLTVLKYMKSRKGPNRLYSTTFSKIETGILKKRWVSFASSTETV